MSGDQESGLLALGAWASAVWLWEHRDTPVPNLLASLAPVLVHTEAQEVTQGNVGGV